MTRRNDPTALMWAQACEILAQADRMQQQFFRLSSQASTQATWQPPADVFETDREILIVVALPGVDPQRVEVFSDGGAKVRQVEIPYGYFERRVALPSGALELTSHELNNGCLMLRLRKHAQRTP